MRRLYFVILLLFSANSLFGYSVQEDMLEASNSMKNLIRSQNSIPIEVIKTARAIVIVPESVKFGFILGGRYGDGVGVVRQGDGSWSYPFFIKLGGGSFGLQIGFEMLDTILVFRTKNSVDELLSSKFTLGIEASACAGPLGVNAEKRGEADMSSEIYTYSQNSGLFAGATLNGAVISVDDEKNRALYGNDMSLQKIVTSTNLSDLYGVKDFLKNLNNLTKE